MIIIHENLHKELARLADTIKSVFGFASESIEMDLEGIFSFIPEFNGYSFNFWDVERAMRPEKRKVLFVTHRDIYGETSSKDDDWVFGESFGDITLVSTARMKKKSSDPSDTSDVREELFLRRLETLAVHEIGHDVVKAPHYKPAAWVNAQTGYEQQLGPHCTDSRCVMYEIVDIRAPHPTKGFMRLGTEKRYDAGLDDLLERIYPTWFCDLCAKSTFVDESYR